MWNRCQFARECAEPNKVLIYPKSLSDYSFSSHVKMDYSLSDWIVDVATKNAMRDHVRFIEYHCIPAEREWVYLGIGLDRK